MNKKSQPPQETLEEIETRLYDLQKSPEKAQELLAKWQNMTGRNKPGFWQGPYPPRKVV